MKTREQKKAYNKAYYEKYADKLKGDSINRYRKNRDFIVANWRRKREANPLHFLDYELKRSFGISASDYIKMLEDQGGVCGVCLKPEKTLGRGGKVKRLSVDHDHTTGTVRGLLCSSCNQAIGLLKEDPKTFQLAVEYLKRFSSEA